MKAIIWTRYGPPEVLQHQEIPTPEPKENEVRIRVRASTVFAGDAEMRQLAFSAGIAIPMRIYIGFFRPKRVQVLGQEVAGVVESAGQAVTRFQVGDEVFGTTGFRFGAYAEYCCLPEGSPLAIKPNSISFEEAAPLAVGGSEALHFIRKGQVRAGQQVLINGAGGSIGTYAVQIAKHLGAQVTAVDTGEKLGMLRELGADHVLDYTRKSVVETGRSYDAVFDVVGKGPVEELIGVLKEGGVFLVGNPRSVHRTRGVRLARSGGKRIMLDTANPQTEDLLHLAGLHEQGALRTVIDRRFPLSQAAEGHRYVETGRKQGNVVLIVD